MVAWDATFNSYYSLIMIDLDAPSRVNPSYGNILHWLVVNIPGSQINQGEVKAEYFFLLHFLIRKLMLL